MPAMNRTVWQSSASAIQACRIHTFTEAPTVWSRVNLMAVFLTLSFFASSLVDPVCPDCPLAVASALRR